MDGVGPQMDSQFWSQQAVDRVKELLPPTQMSMKMYQVTCTARDGDRTLVKVLDANGKGGLCSLIDILVTIQKSLHKPTPTDVL